jgi:DNA-binding transcriptional MerR regulator
VPYRTSHVCKLFEISYETVRNWTTEFGEYLSPTAKPGKHRKRLYTDLDMRVFSLVAELKQQGMTYEEIHANLQSGERGKPPTLDPKDLQALVTSETEHRLALEVERLQQALIRTQAELKQVEELRQELEQTKRDNIRFEAKLESITETARDERERLETRVRELTQRIEELARESGKEYARGMIDALGQRGDLNQKD